jgi:chromosome segregation ATPase
MPGHLRGKRNAMGDRDDVEIEMRKGHFKLARTVDKKLSASNKMNSGLREKINSQANQIQRLENQIHRLTTNLSTAGGEVEQLKTAVVELNKSFVNLRSLMLEKLSQANERINNMESLQRRPILIPVKQILE